MGLRAWWRPVRSTQTSVAFIGLPSEIDGLLADQWSRGKITFDYFFPPFARVLSTYSISVQAFRHKEFCAKPRRGDVAILVYTEGQANRLEDLVRHILSTQAFAQRSGFRIVHPLEIGLLVIDKMRTNRLLAAAGIPVPKLIMQEKAPSLVFSNANSSSQQPVFLHQIGVPLDPKRYNTEFIDTTFRYAGKDYYVVLRAMCVGGACYSIVPRARPVADGCPSVHASNTLLDVGLLNAVHAEIIMPRKALILEICERLGRVLGLGFFAHDILPSAVSDALFVCETGFKFDNRIARERMASLRGQLTEDGYLTDEAPTKAAHALAKELLSGERRALG